MTARMLLAAMITGVSAGLASLTLPALADVGGKACLGSWLEDQAEIDGLVFGTNSFEQAVGPDLTLRVSPDPSGWQVQMFKGQRSLPTQVRPSGIPPQTSPSGPNTTEYVFGEGVVPAEEMIVPGGPGRHPQIAPTVEPEYAGSGRMFLEIEEQAEFETKNENGSTTQSGYLDFKACVIWNVFPREVNDIHYGGTGVPEEIPKWKVVAFEDCGLPSKWRLSARMFRREPFQPAILEPDLDGDGHTDLLAIVQSEEKETLFGCLRAGRKLVPVSSSTPATSDLEGGFLEEADWWNVTHSFEIDESTGSGANKNPDRVTIGIEGASSQEIHLTEGLELSASWQGD